MKKLILLLIVFIFNYYSCQQKNVVNIKFDEKKFIADFIVNKTQNSFLINVFKTSDSLSEIDKKKDYLVILDSVLKHKMALSSEEEKELLPQEKKEFDSLKIQIQNGHFLSLMKKAVEVNFGTEFLENTLKNLEINNFKINKIDYNKFSLILPTDELAKKTKAKLSTHQLSFHESLSEYELQNVQDCFMSENVNLVQNNYLKKENDYLLIYKSDAEIFGNLYQNSKCINTKNISILLNNGEDYDTFSKLFFVKNTTSLEDKLVKSIKGLDFSTKEDKTDYNKNFFYLSIYLDDKGKDVLSEYTDRNRKKKIYTANNLEFVSMINISEKIQNGIYISGNLFTENWQKLHELIKYEVFKNALHIE